MAPILLIFMRTNEHTSQLLVAPNALWPTQPKFFVAHAAALPMRTFDTHEDGEVRVTETVGDCTEIVELIAAVHVLNMQRSVSQGLVVRSHDVTQSVADVTSRDVLDDDVMESRNSSHVT